MLKKSGLLFLLVITILSGCEVPSPEQVREKQHQPAANFSADAGKGNVIFHQYCARCHGEKGKGSNQGPPLIHKIYRPDHHADQSFHWAVKDGTKQHHWHFGNMPPIVGVSPEQVGHIVAYVRQEQRRAGIR